MTPTGVLDIGRLCMIESINNIILLLSCALII